MLEAVIHGRLDAAVDEFSPFLANGVSLAVPDDTQRVYVCLRGLETQ